MIAELLDGAAFNSTAPMFRCRQFALTTCRGSVALAFQFPYISAFFFFLVCHPMLISFFFFFNDTATTEIYTLSLHDALPIYGSTWTLSAKARRGWITRSWTISTAIISARPAMPCWWRKWQPSWRASSAPCPRDRKSTRLNSSHQIISYAVFCLKKKKAHSLTRRWSKVQLPAASRISYQRSAIPSAARPLIPTSFEAVVTTSILALDSLSASSSS